MRAGVPVSTLGLAPLWHAFTGHRHFRCRNLGATKDLDGVPYALTLILQLFSVQRANHFSDVARLGQSRAPGQVVERLAKRVGGLESIAWVAAQGLHHDVVERLELRPQLGRADDGVIEQLVERGCIGFAFEKASSGQRLPEDDAKAEEVGALVGFARGCLLRCHVRELALELTRARRRHANVGFRNAEVG